MYSDPDGRDLVKGAKFDKRAMDSLVELAKRPEGRKLLEKINNLSATIELNHGKAYADDGNEIYGTGFATNPRGGRIKNGDIDGKFNVRLNFELAERDRKLEGAVEFKIKPPKSDAALTGHELEHFRRAADGIDTQDNQMEGKNREVEDAIDAQIEAILKQKPDSTGAEAKAFVENILKPNEPKD